MSIICYDSNGNLLEGFYQWDVNQTISVTGFTMDQTPMFHFCNRCSQFAIVVAPEMVNGRLTADVPNSLLREPETLFVYLYYNTNNDGKRTAEKIRIPVVPRQRPVDYVEEDNIDYVSAEIIDQRLVELIEEMATQLEPNLTSELHDIRNGYDGTTYTSAGDAVRAIGSSLEAINRTPSVYNFLNGDAYDDYIIEHPNEIRPGDFIIIGSNLLYIKTPTGWTLLFSHNNLYRKPSTGIPYNDLSDEVKTMISNGNGSGETVIVEGDSIKMYGFASESAYNQFIADCPDAIKTGDYIWIGEATPFNHKYTLYVADTSVSGRNHVFSINDTLLVEVTDNNGVLSTNYSFNQIQTNYSQGKSIKLLTEFGTVLDQYTYGYNNWQWISVIFSGAIDLSGETFGVTYTIDSSGVEREFKALSTFVVQAEPSATPNVYTITSPTMPYLRDAIDSYVHVYNGRVVLNVDELSGNIGQYSYPFIDANRGANGHPIRFGRFDPSSEKFVMFTLNARGNALTRTELSMSGGGNCPQSSVSDAGKILMVNSSGVPEWVEIPVIDEEDY